MIYFVRVPIETDGGPAHIIKIGTTIRLSERIKQLKSEFGPDLSILGVLDGSFREERSLHRRFEEYRLDRELFSSVPAILDFIACECGAWDGVDEVLPLSSVKIDVEVLRMVRLVAEYRGITAAQYLSEAVRPIAERDLKHEVDAFEIPPKKSPKRKGRKGGSSE